MANPIIPQDRPIIVENQAPIPSLWKRITDVFLKVICFWKWFTPSRPLSDIQVTTIKHFRPDRERDTDEGFKNLLANKIKILVGCVHEKHIEKTVAEISKAADEAPEAIRSIFALAETAEDLAGTKSPLEKKIEDLKLVQQAQPLNELLEKLTKNVDYDLLKTTIEAKINEIDADKNTLKKCVPHVIEWLKNGRATPLHRYLTGEGLEGVLLAHTIFQISVRALFTLKKEAFLKDLESTLKDSPAIIRETLDTQSKAVGEELIDKLNTALSRMEGDFSKTFDDIVKHVKDHFTPQALQVPEQPLKVGDVDAYVKQQEADYFKALANTIIDAIAPELSTRSESSLHEAIAPLAKLQEIYRETFEISQELLPPGFNQAIKGYVEGPKSIIFNAEKPYIRLQLEKGLVKTFESIRNIVTEENEREAILTDSVLPALEEQIKTTFIRQVLHMNSKTIVPFFATYLNSERTDDDLFTLQNSLYPLTTTHANQSKWTQEEFNRLSAPVLKDIADLILRVHNNERLTLDQVKFIIDQYAKRNPEISALEVEQAGPIYNDLIKTLVFKVGEFGTWNEWLFGFKKVQKQVAESILASVNNFRATPKGIIASSLDSLNETLTHDKFMDLLSESLEDLNKSEADVMKKFENVSNKINQTKAKIKANKEKLENYKKLDASPIAKRKVADITLKNEELLLDIATYQSEIDGTILPQFMEIQAKITKAKQKNILEAEKVKARKLKRPQIIRNIAETVFDIFQINAANAAGSLGKWIARKVTGNDATPLNDLITKVYQRLFNNPNLSSSLNKILGTFTSAIVASPVPRAFNPQSARNLVTPAPYNPVNPLSFPPQNPIDPIDTGHIPDASQASLNHTSDLLQGTGTLIKNLFKHAFEIARKKFLKPAFQAAKDSTEGLAHPFNEFTSIFVDFVNENKMDQGNFNHNLNIVRVKELDLAQAIPDDLKSTVRALGFDDDRKYAEEILDKVQYDSAVLAKLNVIAYSDSQSLENYTHPILAWLLNRDNQQDNYDAFPALPDLDPALVKTVLGIYVDYLANARLQYLVKIANEQFQGQLEKSLMDVLPGKLDIISNRLIARTTELLGQMRHGSFTQAVDQLLTTVNSTTTFVNAVNYGYDDELQKSKPMKKGLFTNQELLKYNDLAHESTKKIIGLPKHISENTVLDEYYENMSKELITIFLPKRVNSPAVPAEKAVSPSKSTIKENSTYENGTSEQLGNQEDKASAETAVNSLITELGVFKEIHKKISYYHQLVEPFLTSDRNKKLAQVEEQLLKEIETLATSSVTNIIKKALKKGIKLGLDTLRTAEMSILLADTILPAISEAVLGQHISVACEDSWKNASAEFDGYFKTGNLESKKAQKEAILANGFTTFKKTSKKADISREGFDKIASPLFDQLEASILAELASASNNSMKTMINNFYLPSMTDTEITISIQEIFRKNGSSSITLLTKFIDNEQGAAQKIINFIKGKAPKKKYNHENFERIAVSMVTRLKKTFDPKAVDLKAKLEEALKEFDVGANNCPLGELVSNTLNLVNFGNAVQIGASLFTGKINTTLVSLIHDLRKNPDLLLKKIVEGLQAKVGDPEQLRAIMLEETDTVKMEKQKTALQDKKKRVSAKEGSLLKTQKIERQITLLDQNIKKAEEKKLALQVKTDQAELKKDLACTKAAGILYDFIKIIAVKNIPGTSWSWLEGKATSAIEKALGDSKHLDKVLSDLLKNVLLNPAPLVGENIALTAGTIFIDLFKDAATTAAGKPLQGKKSGSPPSRKSGGAASAATAPLPQ